MLRIKIVGSSGDDLILRVNGRPNKGRSEAEAGWAVRWKVRKFCDVDHIEEIRMKTNGGGTNIFTDDPPAPLDSNKKRWKASIDRDATVSSEYVYDIVWVKKGESQARTYDPIIAIKPSTGLTLTNILTATVAISAAVAISYFLFGSGKKWKKNKIW